MKIFTALLVLAGTAFFFVTEARNAPERNEWSLRPADEAGHVQFALESRRGNGRWHTSWPVSWESIKGLTKEQASAMNAPVKFEMVRDAGRVLCEGTTHFGRASGAFTFEMDPRYRAELEKLGFQVVGDRRPIDYFMMDISLNFARAVREIDPQASGSDLVDLRAHGVDREYMTGLRDAGYTNMHSRDFIELRNHGVSTEFARDVKKAGYEIDTQELVNLRNHGVDAAFMSELRKGGYAESVETIVNLRNHGVDRDYIRRLAALGLKPDGDDLAELKNHGVDPEFLRGLKDAGYGDLGRDQIVHLRNHGVPVDFIRDAAALGYRFSPDELTQMRDHGVDSNYLRKVKASGFDGLTAEKIIKLRQHGVD